MFTPEETQSLLAEKGIGKTVLQRLQQMGLDDVAKLAAANVDDMLQQGAALTGSTCWKTIRRHAPPCRLPWIGQSGGRQPALSKSVIIQIYNHPRKEKS